MKLMIEWKRGSRKRKGRPRSNWMKEVKEDLKKIGIVTWQTKIKKRQQLNKIARRIKSEKWEHEPWEVVHPGNWI